ncbi:MAG: ATP-binding protein [Anaerolineae bacterium]|nr:ATP-binding protein [Anaerolineae bacterium]
MNYLLSGLLDREQAEKGPLRLSFVPCDLVRVIRNVISMAPPDSINRIELKGLRKLELKADERRLHQIFYNLMENALKYAPSDQNIPINIYRQGDWAVVEINDRGKALSQEEIAKLFQAFYRTEEAQKSGIPSTGLGLFILKRWWKLTAVG